MHRLALRLLLITALLLLCRTAPAQDAPFSIILEGGTVYDGLGNPPVVADVGLKADTTAAIGDLSGQTAETRIDVRGLAVTPGFIDIHSHASSGTPEESSIFQRPLAENYLQQGVTTALGGQDGSSPFPLGAFLGRLDAQPAAINFGAFVGHGTVRARVMGAADRRPSDAELQQMASMVAEAMKEGAFGLSSGLEYTPGMFADPEELITLARATAPYGGLYISHIRDEGGKLLDSVAEVIRVGEEGGVKAQVTHHKVVGPDRWGRSTASLALIDAARKRGVDVASDVYPYTASSTGLTILFPNWSRAGGNAALRARLGDPEQRAKIRQDIAAHLSAERGGDPATIVAATCSWNHALDGKSLADMLEDQGRPVTVDEAARLAMELQEKGGCQAVLHSMSEDDVRRLMQHPMTMISSDGGIPAMGAGVPHPRNYGAFARVLTRYVREQKALSFEEAVRKMTSLPAERLGLAGRGVLRVGAFADIAVLDPATIQDHATFARPHQYATGVRYVFVNGTTVLRDGKPTGARPGRVLRKTDQ